MFKLINRFQKNDAGATAIEYGLIAALIGTAIIVGAGSLGSNLGAAFTKIGTTITTKTQ